MIKATTPQPSHIDPASLNTNLKPMGVSATLAINERSKELQASGRKVHRLGLGQSPFPVPPRVTNALRKHAGEKDYLPVRGLPTLRKAVAEFHRRHDDINCSQDDVLIGPGSKELMFILQLTYKAELLIPAPSWVSYAPQAQILGSNARWISTQADNNWQMTPDALEAACKINPEQPKLLILNYPSNPTGHSFTKGQLIALTHVARANNVLILSDEIYGLLDHQGEHLSIARFYPEGTIVSSGLSKWCGAGGWRLGTFLFPPKLRWLLDAMAIVASETYTSVSAPIQYAAVAAFEEGDDIKIYLDKSRRVLRSLAKHLCDRLRSIDIAVTSPKGGFYLFPDFEKYRETFKQRGITTSTQLCEMLLNEAGVAMLPGSDFGRPEGELTVRLAYVDFDGEHVLSVLKNDTETNDLTPVFLRQHCANTIEAMDKIIAWATAAEALPDPVTIENGFRAAVA
ncbi:MAG: aspartate aminotransferase [Pseudohongiellaceae bacterium]|jgi:aspartate aminotransferase